jgi:predicted secreted protein
MVWRRALGSAILFTVMANSAQASDGAALHVFGFSPQGDRFAYEESGIQDGSGFSFDRIVIIDIKQKTLRQYGSVLQDDTAGIDDDERMRLRVRAQADRFVGNGGLGRYSARLVAQDAAVRAFDYLSGDMIGSSCSGQARLALPVEAVAPQGKVEVRRPEEASPFDARRLRVRLVRGDKTSVSLSVVPRRPDTRINDVTHASLAAVYMSGGTHGRLTIVAVVNECHKGFEGPDRRFLMAVGYVTTRNHRP